MVCSDDNDSLQSVGQVSQHRALTYRLHSLDFTRGLQIISTRRGVQQSLQNRPPLLLKKIVHIPSTVIYLKIMQLKTPNVLAPVTGELGAISKLSYLGEERARERACERRNRPLLSRLLPRAQSRASTFHDIPQMESLLAG